jgi:hypothetical protein
MVALLSDPFGQQDSQCVSTLFDVLPVLHKKVDEGLETRSVETIPRASGSA